MLLHVSEFLTLDHERAGQIELFMNINPDCFSPSSSIRDQWFLPFLLLLFSLAI
jgi:hypothetical protein